MNYYNKKNLGEGSTILLSENMDTLKKHVLNEIQLLEKSSIPCCLITYNEICDNTTGKITRTSDLNPFMNINIKELCSNEYLAYLPDIILCFLTIIYERTFNENERKFVEQICTQLDLSKDDLSFYDIFQHLSEGIETPDNFRKVYNKIDITVETIKNDKDFYCEASDPAILFFNFVYLILSLKEVYDGNRVWIYTDLFDYLSEYNEVMLFLQKLLKNIDRNMYTINYLVSKDNLPNFLSDFDIHFIMRLDESCVFHRYKEYFRIGSIRWNHFKTIKV